MNNERHYFTADNHLLAAPRVLIILDKKEIN